MKKEEREAYEAKYANFTRSELHAEIRRIAEKTLAMYPHSWEQKLKSNQLYKILTKLL